MRLARFIEQNVEPILTEWETFARRIWPTEAEVSPEDLRNGVETILRATLIDMRSDQSEAEREEKSRGGEVAGAEAASNINRASAVHGAGRVGSGFDLAAVVAEYRALRASVIRLWRASIPGADPADLEDLTRFNESMDQSLMHAVDAFVGEVAQQREATLARERELRSEAEAANRAKDMFLATLSHEMRTPLNAIVGWISILRDTPDEQDLAEGLEVIDRSTRAQAQLIDDVLDVSRIVSGKLRINPRPCNLAEVVEAGIDAVRPAAEARNITLEVRLDADGRRAFCDPTRLQQVVWNLVSNAVKFTPKGGKVAVSLGREQSSMQIQVSDNGSGIETELLPHVFDPFRQADSSTRRRYAGLGLGLSIVKNLVEAHGGVVEAYSAGQGKGATFTVLLPIQAVEVDERGDHAHTEAAHEDHGAGTPPIGPVTEEPAGPLTRLDGIRILIVDDEPDARRLLARLLGHLGAKVTTAPDVAAALELVTGFRPHVLVSDIGMPSSDGVDLIREVRRRGHRPEALPAVALTAYAQKDDEARTLEAGYQAHLTKPVHPGELTAVITRLAGMPQA